VTFSVWLYEGARARKRFTSPTFDGAMAAASNIRLIRRYYGARLTVEQTVPINGHAEVREVRRWECAFPDGWRLSYAESVQQEESTDG
jgi:hypothetical protein